MQKKIFVGAILVSLFSTGGFLSVQHVNAQGVPRPDLVTAPKFVGNQLRYNISNEAPGPLNGTFEVQVRWLSSTNVQIGSPSIRSVSTPLPIQSMLTHTPQSFITPPPAGADHVEVTVDSGTDIIETNDGNNVGYVSLPELSIDSVTAASDGIRFVLRNSGPGPVSGLSSVVGITASYRMEWLREDETVISTGTGSYVFSMSPNNVHTILNNSPFATTERPSDARKLRVTFDTPDAILERDSTNNSRTADVALASMDLALDTPLSFNATSATYIVKNNTSNPVSGTYTLRAGWVAAEGTTLLSPITTPVSLSIPADGTVTLTHTNAAFYGAPDGRATKLRLSINPSDIAGFTDETDFSNNSREADRTTFPDFSLENLTNVSWGVGFDIRNSGPVTFSGSVPVNFYWLSSTGATVGTSSATGFTATIPSGGTFHAARIDGFMADVPAGASRVRLVVNDPAVSYAHLPESGTVSNTAEIARSGIPDLTIESATVNSTSTTYTIRNLGNVDFNARLGHRYSWVRPGNYVMTTTGSLLTAETVLIPAGGTFTRTDDNSLIAARPRADTHLRIEVNPDGLGHVTESDDENNTLNVTPLPDLTVESLSLTATSTSVTFRNVGGGTYSGLFRYHFYWDGPEGWVNPLHVPGDYGTASTISHWTPVAYVNAITVGQAITFAHGEDFIQNPPDGATRFGVEINGAGVGRNPETSYDNNVRFIDIASIPRPDFIFESAALSGTSTTFTVRNVGPVEYQGILNLRFEWRNGGSPLTSSVRGLSFLTLDANGTITRTIGGDAFFGVAPAGADRMRITVNPESAVQAIEADYDNNTVDVPRPIADLIVESAAYDSAVGRTRYVIKNIGTLTSFRETQVRFDWFESDSSSGGTSYDGGIWNLPPNESLERTYVHSAGTATRLRIIVDNNGAIPESDNNNNSLEISLIAEDTTGEELVEAEEEEALEDIAAEAGGGQSEQEQSSDAGEQETGEGTDSSDGSSSGSEGGGSGSSDETRQSVGGAKGGTTVPKVLPGSFAYIFKNMGRGIRSALTFNTEAKAELRLQFAAEKLLEANALTEKGEGDRAAEHLASYADDIAKVSSLAAKLSAKDETAGNALASRAAGNALRHQTIIGKIERGAGVEGRVMAEEARELALEHTAKTIALVKSEEETQKIVANALKRDGSPFRSLRNLEIIDAVGPKLSGAAAEAVKQEKDLNQNALASQLKILPVASEQLLASYIKNSGGQEDSYVKSLEVASAKGAPRTAAFIEAESEARVRLQTRVEALVATPERAAKALERLSDGSVAGLRALHAVVDSIESKGKTHAEEALKGAIEKIKTHNKQTLSKELSEVRDITGLRVIEDIKAASPEKKTELEAVEKVLVRDIANTVTKAQGQKNEINDRAVNAIVNTSPEAAMIIERVFKDDTKTKNTLLKMRLEQVESAAETDKKEKPLKTEKKSDTSQVRPAVKEETPRSTEPSKEKVMPFPEDVKESVAPSFQKTGETTKMTKPTVAPKTETAVPTPPKTVTEPSTKTVLPAVEQVAVPAKEPSPQLPTPIRETVVVPTTEAVVVPIDPRTIESASVCTKEIAYVCGVNGITYLNSCLAKQAGIAVSYVGECKFALPKTETTISIPPTTSTESTVKTTETTTIPTTTSESVKTAPATETTSVEVPSSTQTMTPTKTAPIENTATTKVSPPSATFQTSTGATSVTVSSGTAVTLIWKTSDATSVSIDQNLGAVEGSGSRAVKVLKTTTYTLIAKNSAGVRTAAVTVTVK